MIRLSILQASFANGWNALGLFLSGFSVFAIVGRMLSLELNQILQSAANLYKILCYGPIDYITRFLDTQLSAQTKDSFWLYLFFGACSVRSLMLAYKPDNGRVIKGLWGAISNNIFTRGLRPNNFSYSVLAVVFWPAILVDFCIRHPYIYRRYGGTDARPDLDEALADLTLKVRDATVYSERYYQRSKDYYTDGHTWLVYFADFRVIFLLNLLATAAAVALFFVLNSAL